MDQGLGDKDIERGDRGRLHQRHEAAEDAADGDHGHADFPFRCPGGGKGRTQFERRPRGLGAHTHHHAKGADRDHQDEARDDARLEQIGDRHPGDDGVQDHREARRK